MFRDFARWLAFAFGVFSIAVLALLAGQVGFFGASTQEQLRWLFNQGLAFYVTYKANIDLAAWLLGVGVSAATATHTIHRTWYYAERNLPQRLLALVKERIAHHLNERPALLAAVNDPVAPDAFLAPVVHTGYFNWVLRAAGFSRHHIDARIHEDALATIADEIKAVRGRQEELEAHAVTAHLLRGAKLAGEAAQLPSDDPNRRTQNEKSLAAFEAALAIKRDDVDALEMAGRQSLVLGDHRPATDYFEWMADAARRRELPLRQARALRLQAETLEKSIDPDDWDRARGILLIAIEEVT